MFCFLYIELDLTQRLTSEKREEIRELQSKLSKIIQLPPSSSLQLKTLQAIFQLLDLDSRLSLCAIDLQFCSFANINRCFLCQIVDFTMKHFSQKSTNAQLEGLTTESFPNHLTSSDSFKILQILVAKLQATSINIISSHYRIIYLCICGCIKNSIGISYFNLNISIECRQIVTHLIFN